MSDRRLLEMAAKAAGIVIIRSRLDDLVFRDMLIKGGARNPSNALGPWNPLTDDGDEARLEACLQLHVEWHPAAETVTVGTAEIACTEPYGSDRQAARKRAGVRAAASVGEAME